MSKLAAMTHDEMIEVIKAHKEGKTIQCLSFNGWTDIHNPIWDFYNTKYRVKKEPQEFYIVRGLYGDYVFPNENAGLIEGFRKEQFIKVREVI